MYSYAKLQKLFDQLKQAHPELLSIHNDVLPPIVAKGTEKRQRSERHQVQLTKQKGGTQNIQLDYDRDKRIKEIATFFKCSPETAVTTYGILRSIYGLNPCGAWYIGEQPNPGDGLLDQDAEIVTPHARDYVHDLYDEMASLLPSVVSIKVIRYTEHQRNGSKRVKAMLRFMAGKDVEIAAMDVQIMNLHLRHCILPENTVYAGLNDHREALLQKQLGIQKHDWPVILHTLLLFSSTLPLSEIVIGDTPRH